MELVTVNLSRPQMLGQVPEIQKLFISFGVKALIVEYGWGSGGDQDCQWKDFPVPTELLPSFVEESVANGVFRPGTSDLFVRNADQTIEFKLCHESDIHVLSADAALIEKVGCSWRERGLDFSVVVTGAPASA